ncbi:MAG: DUF2752 domain-containing protein [Muribaculaceae bacterium]|nr:DUF2752 domain-containing protein [Muribaculaceae bacterium]
MSVAAVVVLMVLAVVYFFFDPVEAAWMPKCIWKVATGTDCPGCGSQRMAHALMHGDFRAAWHANAFALCMLPVIAFLLLMECLRERYQRLYCRVHSPLAIGFIAVAVVVWWIVRNLI